MKKGENGHERLPRDGNKDVRRGETREHTTRIVWLLLAQRGNKREAEKDLFAEPAAVAKVSRITRYNYERWLHFWLAAAQSARRIS